jgi:2-iminobutanoate/2-iminopropanoate deaminase
MQDAIEVRPKVRRLFTFGTPGLEANGELPASITSRSEVACKHILRMLEQAEMAQVMGR